MNAVKSLLLAISVTFTVAASAQNFQQNQNRLPEIGTAGGAIMSVDRERVIGDFYMRQIRATAPLISDPALDEYLADMGNRLVRHADGVRFPFSFFWINNKDINAFAFLGGYVGVHTGLILEAHNESELAAVIGHEIAHITQRHMVRNIEQQSQNSGLTLASVLGALILGIANPELGTAALTATMAGNQQSVINYTRLYEQEADRIGMNTLASAGFDPRGAPNFFGRLADRYRYSSKMPEMLMTHPVTESRIADTRNRAQMLPHPSNPPSLKFALAKARVQARYAAADADSFRRNLNSRNPITAAAARYGLAIAQLDSGQPAAAEETLAPLLKESPLESFYVDVESDILLNQQRYDDALAMLEHAYIRRPNEEVITINYANAAIKAGQPRLSIKLLRDFLLREPKHLLALQILSDAYRDVGDIANMYETNAEVIALYGGFRNAIDQLHTAYTRTDNELTKKRIQARIEQMREMEQRARTL